VARLSASGCAFFVEKGHFFGAGDAVDKFIETLIPLLEPGDIIIDGGNSNFHDTIRRCKAVERKKMLFIGTGVSGGEEGARRGPSIMPGGSEEAWPHVKDIFQAVSAKADNGQPCCDWVGKNGAGHFVKMVHNGIEYGDMQLICEAYQMMQAIGMTAQPLTLIGEAVFARCLSAMKDERVAASAKLRGPKVKLITDPAKRAKFVEDIRQALYASKIISYAQGFQLMREAAKEYKWKLDYASIALMWRGGCIIRSQFLGKISDAFVKRRRLVNLLLNPHFSLHRGVGLLRRIPLRETPRQLAPSPARLFRRAHIRKAGQTSRRVLPHKLDRHRRRHHRQHIRRVGQNRSQDSGVGATTCSALRERLLREIISPSLWAMQLIVWQLASFVGRFLWENCYAKDYRNYRSVGGNIGWMSGF